MGGEFFGIRHGVAEYKLNESIIKSENPEAAPDANKQWFNSDLTPEGKILAKEKAEEFFNNLNPETDALFFVSSDLVRAAETARIYLDVARERGFEIILPRERNEQFPELRKNKAEEIGEGYIRKINCLTLDHLENMLREQVFKPNDYLADSVEHLENVSDETKEGWAKARKIIEADNKGTWGANYAAHSEAIAEIFPNVKSAKEIYKSKFLKMMQLVRFGQEKIGEQNPAKNIKVLGFSHENSFLQFLNENFGESMGNCESIGFNVLTEDNQDVILATAKGRTVEVKE
ncbi:MAG: histidine phosphatase family protein [Leadbetterella sp.]|nr:histidine phosphatase family protein [Leadbetterella sp.]